VEFLTAGPYEGVWQLRLPGVHQLLGTFPEGYLGHEAEDRPLAVRPGAEFWKCLHKRKTVLREGKVDTVLRSLGANLRRFADRPERLSDLPERTPGRILWTHVFYIEKHRDRGRTKGPRRWRT
jgi:hypothetical protein